MKRDLNLFSNYDLYISIILLFMISNIFSYRCSNYNNFIEIQLPIKFIYCFSPIDFFFLRIDLNEKKEIKFIYYFIFDFWEKCFYYFMLISPSLSHSEDDNILFYSTRKILKIDFFFFFL